MTIFSFLTKDVTIKRLETVSGNKSNYQTVTVISGHRQNLADDEIQVIDGATSKSYKVWAKLDAEVKEGDRLEIEGDEYEVLSTEEKDYGINQHMEIVCEALDEGGE
jgi:mevalonate pyrophosphate decarboxylase